MTPEVLNRRQYAAIVTVAVLSIAGIAGIVAGAIWVAVRALL
jgi:hypothetical protein